MHVLLLEDDRDYRESIVDFLHTLQANVDAFENGDEALVAAYEKRYDLLLLDVKVPGKSGYEITKTLRDDGVSTPIVLITSLTEVDNLSIGYEMGCNDYLRKPFSLKELKYRMLQAISANQYHHTLTAITLMYGYVFDISTEELSKEGKSITLTAIEKKIMELLIKRRGTYVDKFEIISHVWEDVEKESVDLRMHILRIRTKTDPRLIVNTRGLGYKIEKI